MILIISYILNLLAPIINAMGLVGAIIVVQNGDYFIFIWTSLCTILGLVFGWMAHNKDIPPRWFWAKSANQIFEFRIMAVLGYAVSVATYPTAIYLIQTIINNYNNLLQL